MVDLELGFESETENGNKVSIVAKFEHISEFEETPFGERKISYWHLVSIKFYHSFSVYYVPTNNDYKEFETEAMRLASQEAA